MKMSRRWTEPNQTQAEHYMNVGTTPISYMSVGCVASGARAAALRGSRGEKGGRGPPGEDGLLRYPVDDPQHRGGSELLRVAQVLFVRGDSRALTTDELGFRNQLLYLRQWCLLAKEMAKMLLVTRSTFAQGSPPF